MDELQKIRYAFNTELFEINTIGDVRKLVIKYLGENDGILVKFAVQLETHNQYIVDELTKISQYMIDKSTKKCQRIKEKNNETI